MKNTKNVVRHLAKIAAEIATLKNEVPDHPIQFNLTADQMSELLRSVRESGLVGKTELASQPSRQLARGRRPRKR